MSGALDRFRRLSQEGQNAFVARVQGGWIDVPEGFSSMVEIVREREANRRDRPMPGGTTLGEIWDAQLRRRAGLVDTDGGKGAMDALRARNAASPLGSKPRKKPKAFYPWQRLS